MGYSARQFRNSSCSRFSRTDQSYLWFFCYDNRPSQLCTIPPPNGAAEFAVGGTHSASLSTDGEMETSVITVGCTEFSGAPILAVTGKNVQVRHLSAVGIKRRVGMKWGDHS